MQAAMEKQQEAMDRCQEMVELQGRRIDNVLSTLSSLPQFYLPPKYHPRSNFDPILPHQGNHLGTQGIPDEVDQGVVQEVTGRNHQQWTQNHVPMPRLEIPMFEGKKPRWWVRRCGRFFQFYRIPEDQKINFFFFCK